MSDDHKPYAEPRLFDLGDECPICGAPADAPHVGCPFEEVESDD